MVGAKAFLFMCVGSLAAACTAFAGTDDPPPGARLDAGSPDGEGGATLGDGGSVSTRDAGPPALIDTSFMESCDPLKAKGGIDLRPTAGGGCTVCRPTKPTSEPYAFVNLKPQKPGLTYRLALRVRAEKGKVDVNPGIRILDESNQTVGGRNVATVTTVGTVSESLSLEFPDAPVGPTLEVSVLVYDTSETPCVVVESLQLTTAR